MAIGRISIRSADSVILRLWLTSGCDYVSMDVLEIQIFVLGEIRG